MIAQQAEAGSSDGCMGPAVGAVCRRVKNSPDVKNEFLGWTRHTSIRNCKDVDLIQEIQWGASPGGGISAVGLIPALYRLECVTSGLLSLLIDTLLSCI